MVEHGDGGDRLKRVLDVAAGTFLRGGYASTTMDAIARGAGMSKKTLYQMFPSKLALLEALLRERMVDAPPPPVSDSADPEQRLFDYMRGMSEVILSAEQIALVRIIVADGRDGAVLAAAFRRVAVERDVEYLRRYLSAEMERNAWPMPQGGVDEAVALLFDLTIGSPLIERLIQFEARVPDLDAHIRRGVRFFMRGICSG